MSIATRMFLPSVKSGLGKTVLVTGGAGFIGTHLRRALVRRGYSVLALMGRSGKPVDGDGDGGGATNWLSLAELADAVSRASVGIEAVVHLATAYGHSEDEAGVHSSNVQMPMALLGMLAKFQCRLFLSTDTFFAKPAFDYDHMRPYIDSKREFLAQARQYCAEASEPIRLVNVRLEHVYGPGDHPDKFVPAVLNRLRKNEVLDLTDCTQKRDFVYVSDVVNAYLALLESGGALPVGVSEVEVGCGRSIAIRDFVELAKSQLDSESQINFGARPQRRNEIHDSFAKKGLLQALGWVPEISLGYGLKMAAGVGLEGASS